MAGKVNTKAVVLVFLGALSAFGPFVMDMYLPVLPHMERYFRCSSSLVQLGLTTGLIGLAAGQLIFGPLSDCYGRRHPLICAMLLFVVSTAGCIFATDIHQFTVMRLFQGVAGSGGVVLSRSIAADKYKGAELTSMMSVIAAVNGIATVAAPIAGGLIALIGGWKGIFWSLMVISAILLIGAVRMHESLMFRKTRIIPKDVLSGFVPVLYNRRYIRYVLIYMFSMGVLFTNIASSPFIMQNHYNLTAFHFSIVFGFNAVSFAIASAMIPRFRTRDAAIVFGTAGMSLASLLIVPVFLFHCGFWIYETVIFILTLMVGIVSTASNVSAMDSGRSNAGVASALLGAIGYSFGGVVPAVVGMGNIFTMTSLLFLICSLLTVSALLFPSSRKRPVFRG